MRIRSILTTLALVLAQGCTGGDTDSAGTASDSVGDTTATAAGASITSIANIGLQTPESVLYDEQADVYIVSNINGGPVDRDDNGFISRVLPTGEAESLKWIDGASEGVTLHAPKGLAVHGDTLFVADIDSVRAFHRTSGAPLGARGITGASFLNDLAIGADGTLYVTDTGVDASFTSTGTDAIHRFTTTGSDAVAGAPHIAAPNGIVVDEDGTIIVVGFSGNTVQRIAADSVAGERGAPVSIATLPAGQLDGVVRTSDGTLLVSSWEGRAVYRISPDGQVTTIAENVDSPADIGYDSRRHRVLIPLFNGNRIELRDVH